MWRKMSLYFSDGVEPTEEQIQAVRDLKNHLKYFWKPWGKTSKIHQEVLDNREKTKQKVEKI